MDLDNPSYFSVAVSDDPSSDSPILVNNRAIFSKMGNTDSISSASDCSLSRHPTPPKSEKRPLRSFLRSVSTNSADSNQEMLIMGEPRLSDIAPEFAFKHPSRSNSWKKTAELLARTSEEAEELSGDEVFLAEDSARYYNQSAIINKNNAASGQRRHSIGTFVGNNTRERSYSVTSSVGSFRDDFPLGIIHATSDGDSVGPSSTLQIDDHSLRHASYPRKRCPICTRGAVKKPSNMDDILIVSLKASEAATLWVQYFSTYFEQISKQANRKPFKIQYLSAEDCIKETEEEAQILSDRTSGVKLQLVVLCPGFMEFISQYPGKCQNIGKLFLADRTLALLLGVSDNDMTDVHKKVLPSYFQWQRLSVGQDQDENFTKEFLGQAMTILSKVWKQQSSVSNHDKSYFSVSPKKIRQGQNTVFILLTYPLQKDDAVKVSIERNNEIFEVKSIKRRNPYTIKISVPDILTESTAIVNVLVEKNGSIVGSRPIKCESRLRELEQILRLTNNPVEFMCQTLGCGPANKEQLDNWLLQAFQRNLPAHFNLLANHDTPFAAAVYAHKHSHEEYPTLLHFAAKFGFEKLAMQLLDCPGADVAYDIRNFQDMTPSEIAETNGHKELAITLNGYMKLNQVTNIHTKLKEISTGDEERYLTPKCMEEFYKVCPPPRPVLVKDNDSYLSVITPASDCSSPSGYMVMDTPLIKIQLDSPSESPSSVKEPNHPQQGTKPKVPTRTPSPIREPTIVKNCGPPEFEDKGQKELIEIINDYKNNVHSLVQVEKLVEEWKKRNDVQKSFQEKQEQLNQMRLKYEQIQRESKAATRKPTPIDRLIKLFTREKGRQDKQEITSPISGLSASIVAIQSQRPISSLSTSSSGSSGRMSTVSGSSLGDSGTHSDNEERKHMLAHHDDSVIIELGKAIAHLNYTPVPAPKPVKPGMFLNRSPLFETIEENKPASRPDTLNITEEHYIQFPPSGLPVIPGVIDAIKKTTDQEYMNLVADLPMDREYMNCKGFINR